MKQCWLLVTMLAACGGGGHGTITLDDGGSTADASAKTAVTLAGAGSNIELAVFRDGVGAWQTMTANAQGDYQIQVTSDYAWIIVCGDDTSRDIEMGGALASDGRQFAFCFSASTPPQFVPVTGTMAQAGTVEMADSDTSATTNWSFSVDSEVGTEDFFAFDSSKLAIRRGLAVAATMDVGTVDLATEGTSFMPQVITVDNLGVDTLGTEIELLTTNGFALFDGAVPTLHVPPPSLLETNDFMVVDVTATGANTARRASTFNGVATDYPLPEALTGVAFSGSAATFDPLPDGTRSAIISLIAAKTTEQLEVTADWLVLRGTAGQLGMLDTADVPGFDPTWAVDTSQAHTSSLRASLSAGTTSQLSSFEQNVAGGAPKAALARHAMMTRRDRKAEAAEAAHRDLR